MWYRELREKNSKVNFHYDETDYEESFYRAIKPGFIFDLIL